MKKTIKIISCILGFVLLIFLIFIICWTVIGFSLDVNKITEISQTVTLLDKNDESATVVYSGENRTKIEIENVPAHVKNAFIAIEDERFYSHNGIDVKRIFGATLSNIKSQSKSEGASTITQQLIKLSHLSSQKTFTRKFKEAFLALELDRRYEKDEILEMYLNFCYFGNGAYGIETASNIYFNKSTSELTISEAALLAGILKSPSNYSPHIKYDNSIQRRNLVLKQMLNYNYIDQSQYNEAFTQKIEIQEKTNESYSYGFYVDAVLYETEQILGIDQEDLLKEGYTIYTNLDVSIQESLEKSAKTELPKNQDGQMPEVSMVTMDTNGCIVGLVGGREHTVRRGLNRALDIKRSPGSAIKPVLVYAPAYEYLGYTNTTFMIDEKTDFNGYIPSNSSNKYYGWVTTRKAITQSLNIPAVKTLNEVGIENSKEYAKKVGIPFEDNDDHLALALGGFSKGVSPVTLTASYLPFANGGTYQTPYTVRKITDKNGHVIYSHKDNKQNVLSQDTAFLLTDVMKDVIKTGTGKRLASLNMNIAGKTGTSNIPNSSNNKDAWIVTYTTDYVSSVWIGYDNGSALPNNISGGSYPATLIEQLYLDIYKENKPKDFEKPYNITQVNLDKSMLEQKNKVALAGEYAPPSAIIKEYFTQSTVPIEKSASWQNIENITGLNVTLHESGYPIIEFDSAYNIINYSIYRIEKNSEEKIYETTGTQSKISYTDSTAKKNKKYQYYVKATYYGKEIISDKIEIQTKDVESTQTTTQETKNETELQELERELGTRQREDPN